MNDLSPALTFLYASVCLTAALHPAGIALAFAADMPRELPAARARRAARACLLAGAVLVCVGGVGGLLGALLGLERAAMRIGCGGVLALAAADMALRRAAPAEAGAPADAAGLALSLTGGPGVMAAALLLAERTAGAVGLLLATLAAGTAGLALVLWAMLHARDVLRRLGPVGVAAVGRALAAMLAVMAAQEVLSGLRTLATP